MGTAHPKAHPNSAGAGIVQGKAAGRYQEGDVSFPELFHHSQDLTILPP